MGSFISTTEFLYIYSMKFSFKNDYAEGAHPHVLQKLVDHNESQQNGYGLDEYSNEAKELLLRICQVPNAGIFFVAGGTLANLLVIGASLKPYESVISAYTGHINTNETGAIENTGHKVHGILTEDGKLKPNDIQNVLDEHLNFPHQVKPRMVYISNSTVLGYFYSLSELQDLSAYCKSKELLLYMDGARLGHALMVEQSDVQLHDIAQCTDAFYIDGTKNGALLGEAIHISNPEIAQNFDFYMKQNGALLAKGRVFGLQFLALFEKGLYFDLARKANMQAMKLKKAFVDLKIEMLTDTNTNQIFPILSTKTIEELANHFEFYVWKRVDEEHSAIRLITSWATPETEVQRFVAILQSIEKK